MKTLKYFFATIFFINILSIFGSLYLLHEIRVENMTAWTLFKEHGINGMPSSKYFILKNIYEFVYAINFLNHWFVYLCFLVAGVLSITYFILSLINKSNPAENYEYEKYVKKMLVWLFLFSVSSVVVFFLNNAKCLYVTSESTGCTLSTFRNSIGY